MRLTCTRIRVRSRVPQSGCLFDATPDGRIVALDGDDVYGEDAVGTGSFSYVGALPNADMPASWPGAFLRVAPNGERIAVGNNGGSSWVNYEIGRVFDFPALTGSWYPINHFDAAWYDDTQLAITAGTFGSPSIVTMLDTTSSPARPVNPTVVNNIGGISGGIAFDQAGNLFTGNGYEGDGPSETGWVKVFDHTAWSAAVAGGPPVDFETAGHLVVDALSASSLGFDQHGHLHVGGGDFLGGDDDIDCIVLVHAWAVSDAAAGLGPVDPDNPALVRRIDPDQSTDDNFYTGASSIRRPGNSASVTQGCRILSSLMPPWKIPSL